MRVYRLNPSWIEYNIVVTIILDFVVVVVVFITLTDRAPTIFTNRKQKKHFTRLPIRFVACWTGKKIEKNK